MTDLIPKQTDQKIRHVDKLTVRFNITCNSVINDLLYQQINFFIVILVKLIEIIQFS